MKKLLLLLMRLMKGCIWGNYNLVPWLDTTTNSLVCLLQSTYGFNGACFVTW